MSTSTKSQKTFHEDIEPPSSIPVHQVTTKSSEDSLQLPPSTPIQSVLTQPLLIPPVPMQSEPIPMQSEPIPMQSEPILMQSEPIPMQSKPIPKPVSTEIESEEENYVIEELQSLDTEESEFKMTLNKLPKRGLNDTIIDDNGVLTTWECLGNSKVLQQIKGKFYFVKFTI